MADDTQLLQHVSKKSTNPPAIFFSMRPSSNSKSGVNISRLAGGTAGWQLGTAPEVAAHAGIFGHTSVAEDEVSNLTAAGCNQVRNSCRVNKHDMFCKAKSAHITCRSPYCVTISTGRT
jgi:hypothetical protein